MPEHIKDPFNLIKIFLLNKMEYPYLNKIETEIKFLLMVRKKKKNYIKLIFYSKKKIILLFLQTLQQLLLSSPGAT